MTSTHRAIHHSLLAENAACLVAACAWHQLLDRMPVSGCRIECGLARLAVRLDVGHRLLWLELLHFTVEWCFKTSRVLVCPHPLHNSLFKPHPASPLAASSTCVLGTSTVCQQQTSYGTVAKRAGELDVQGSSFDCKKNKIPKLRFCFLFSYLQLLKSSKYLF